jgi:single-strand DNA-binding protein
MPDLLTLTGVVATAPRHITTNSGLDITSFRLASGQRRFDRDQKKWVDADTNWYTVTTFRQLATNLVGSVERGQHVVVTGRLRIRAWENGDKSGTTIELEADAVGHDLCWGTSVYTKSLATSSSDGQAAASTGAQHGGWATPGLAPSSAAGGDGEANASTEDGVVDSSGDLADSSAALVPF